MTKYEQRRLALKRLVDSNGSIALVASKIGKDASYVSRMLYPEGKAGKKRIGEDSVEILTAHFPNWLSDTNCDSTAGTDSSITTIKPTTTRLTEPLAELLELAKSMSRDGQLILLGRAQELAIQYAAKRKLAK